MGDGGRREDKRGCGVADLLFMTNFFSSVRIWREWGLVGGGGGGEEEDKTRKVVQLTCCSWQSLFSSSWRWVVGVDERWGGGEQEGRWCSQPAVHGKAFFLSGKGGGWGRQGDKRGGGVADLLFMASLFSSGQFVVLQRTFLSILQLKAKVFYLQSKVLITQITSQCRSSISRERSFVMLPDWLSSLRAIFNLMYDHPILVQIWGTLYESDQRREEDWVYLGSWPCRH